MTKAQEELSRLNDEERGLGPARRRAADAKAVMENELVKEAFAEIEQRLTAAIMGSTLDQQDLREDSYRMTRILKMFKGHFEKFLDDGIIADDHLAKIKDRRKWLMKQ